MRYGSVCSGVEAASLAWLQLGWECKFVAEVEPFPCAVLQQRFGATAPIHPLDPAEATNEKDRKMRISWMKQNELLKKEGSIPNEGDFTKIGKKYAGQIDLLVGGTPCQDLSVAGKRAGFDGERSSLAIDFVRLAYESQCKWVVWENVPGVFSSNGGRDFATLLSLFVGREITVPARGWSSAGFVCNDRADRFGLAWRVLDAQFTRTPGFPFAIPQRRRRVFLVGYFGDWSRAAEVLLEPGRMFWDTPSRFKARERFAGTFETDAGMADGKSVENIATFWNGNEFAETLTAKGADDRMPDKGRLPCVVCRANDNTNTGVDVSTTLKAQMEKCAPIILNDQGGSVMSVEDNGNAGTLRANTHGNEQIVCVHGFQDPICHSDCANCVQCNNGLENVTCYDARGNGNGEISPTVTGDHLNRITDYTPTLLQCFAIAENIIGRKVENGGNGVGVQEEVAYTNNATGLMGVCQSSVRRLLPVECERLMGFPDNHTRIAWKGKTEEQCPDSPRYKACGNSMCVNCMEYIGRQIQKNEEIQK